MPKDKGVEFMLFRYDRKATQYWANGILKDYDIHGNFEGYEEMYLIEGFAWDAEKKQFEENPSKTERHPFEHEAKRLAWNMLRDGYIVQMTVELKWHGSPETMVVSV